MSAATAAAAIFFDEDELAQLLRGWPGGMRLAVCLDAGGGCAMVVHHRAEEIPGEGRDAGAVLRRVGEALNRAVGDFAVVPARPGLPTRRMMFSEERLLMQLIGDAEGLLESASDYAMNYAFAAEEGLDIEALVTGRRTDRGTGNSAGKSTAHPASVSPPAALPDPRPTPELEPAPAPLDPAASVPAPHPPEGFRALGRDEQDYSLFTDAMLSLGAAGRVRLITTGAADAGPDSSEIEIAEIYFRDDLLSFAIPIRALAGCQHLPARIVLDEALFPRAMVASLGRGPQAVRLTATGAHLFVGLAPARGPSRAAIRGTTRAPAAPPRPELLRPEPPRLAPARRPLAARLLRGGLGGGALIAGLLLIAQIGLSPAFSHADPKPAQGALRTAIFAPAQP